MSILKSKRKRKKQARLTVAESSPEWLRGVSRQKTLSTDDSLAGQIHHNRQRNASLGYAFVCVYCDARYILNGKEFGRREHIPRRVKCKTCGKDSWV